MVISCLHNEPTKSIYTGYTPVEVHDGWQRSTPETENMDRNMLNHAYELVYSEKRFAMATSLLVFRNGRIVAEAYPMDKNDIFRSANIQSMTKSVTSVMVGVAIQQNLNITMNDLLHDVYPEYFDDDQLKRTMTAEDALTMRSGIDFLNDRHTQRLYSTRENSTRYILSLNRWAIPGEKVRYNDGDPHLISKYIERKSNRSLADFADEFVFQKIGIDNWKWESAKDGTTFGAFSLFLTPRDLGRFGQLLLQGGQWDDESIINHDFLESAITFKVKSNYNDRPYGYYFWLFPQWNAYAAMGHGGQFLFIAPEKQLVVVYTAWPYTGSTLWDNHEQLMSLIYESAHD